MLLDQILVSRTVLSFYVSDSLHVFSDPVGVSGQWNARASDHLPVAADFLFPASN